MAFTINEIMMGVEWELKMLNWKRVLRPFREIIK